MNGSACKRGTHSGAQSLRMCSSDAATAAEDSPLGFAEKPRTHEESNAFAVVEREHAAHAFDDVDDEQTMLPVFELWRRDIERCAADFSELHIATRQPDALRPTKRR